MLGTDDTRGSDDPQAGNEAADELAHGTPGDDFGWALREARLAAGFTVGDVANVLKVTDRTITAIEAERYEDLPPKPYVRGYVQRYARLVGLDEDAVTLGSTTSAETSTVVRAIVPRSRWALFADFARQSWGLVYGSMVLVFVILIGGALWWAWPGGNVEPSSDGAQDGTAVDPAPPLTDSPPELTDRPPVDSVTDAPMGDAADEAAPPMPQEPDETVDPPSVPPALPETVLVDPPAPADPEAVVVDPSAPADPEAVVVDPSAPAPEEPDVVEPVANEVETGDAEAVGADTITFVFDDDCWVEVRDRDGDLAHGNLGRKGDTVTLKGNAPFSVLVGNATGVEVTFNGEPVALTPSAPGEVTRLVVGS